jgi:hypothetical protein
MSNYVRLLLERVTAILKRTNSAIIDVFSYVDLFSAAHQLKCLGYEDETLFKRITDLKLIKVRVE